MAINGRKLLIVTLIYLSLCLIAITLIKPFSILNFLGPAAAIASAFTILWGTGILIAIILGTIIFCLSLITFNEVVLDVPIVLISLLVICLQSVWARQLTYRVIENEQWIKNRAVLCKFIMKIGPLTGLVSASGAVILSMLNAETYAYSNFYVFLITWSGSILISIFVIPAFIFIKDIKNIKLNKRLFVIFASALGFLAIGLLFNISQNNRQQERIEEFEKSKNKILNVINQEVEKIHEQLYALSAFFNASEHVTSDQFASYVKKMHRKNSYVSALEWAPIVLNNERPAFELQTSSMINTPVSIKDQISATTTVIAPSRDVYMPVAYVYPQNNNEKEFGLDVLTHPAKLNALNLSLKLDKMVATPPLTLLHQHLFEPGIVVFSAVYHKPKIKVYEINKKHDQSNVNGYVMAVVKFKPFFLELAHYYHPEKISVFVQDVSSDENFTLYGNSSEKNKQYTQFISDSSVIDFFERKWQVTIKEEYPWVNQNEHWRTWVMLIGGIIGGMIYQLLILMMAAYSIELSHQVAVKTGELISAKEDYERKSLVKSQFLQTFSNELKTPVFAIKYFIAKYKQHPTAKQAELFIQDINNASQNLTKLIDTVVDLTDIESNSPTLQLIPFDFSDFLFGVGSLLNAKNESVQFKFFINENVPDVIESDELRIQTLLISLTENAVKLLGSQNINVSVKAHLHQFKSATLFFVLTVPDNYLKNNDAKNYHHLVNKNLSDFSTSMAIVETICHLFEGDVKLKQLPDDNLVLSCSIKVKF